MIGCEDIANGENYQKYNYKYLYLYFWQKLQIRKNIIVQMQIKELKDFKAGVWVQRFEYKSFSPNKINLQWLVTNPVLQNLLSEADRQLGRLDAFPY